MKIKKYIESLTELAEKYPTAEVIFSCDDEGNAFGKVVYHPSAGKFDGIDFEPKESPDEVNSICIN